MNRHPAYSMFLVWILSAAAYFIMPYQLLERELTAKGIMTLALFMAAFFAGTWIVPMRRRFFLMERPTYINANKAEIWLMVVSGIASVFLFLDAMDKNLFDLVASYESRSATADALLKGDASTSEIWFQLGFLLYPAGYIYPVVHLLYASRIRAWRLIAFGFLPIILATLAMGGRNPIFYGLVVTWLAIKERKKVDHASLQRAQVTLLHKWLIRLAIFASLGALFYYFISVFLVRAEVVGGPIKMFEVAEQNWGVAFRGPLADIIFAVFGANISYLIFIFIWYLVQGFVISAYLLSAYDGPLQMGAYGIDLMSALMRRLDPQWVADGFDKLLIMGTYGFLPAAWGSLYVDFGFFAIILCMLWGAFASICYKRIVVQRRKDWLLIGPFVTAGIMLSVMNTPIGFANGFITHAWLLITFTLLKREYRDRTQEKS